MDFSFTISDGQLYLREAEHDAYIMHGHEMENSLATVCRGYQAVVVSTGIDVTRVCCADEERSVYFDCSSKKKLSLKACIHRVLCLQ
jgi:hypothetical protein